MLKYVTEKDYAEEVKEGIVLVDFYADWCGPCKMIAPILETFASKHEDVKVLKVNVDEEQGLAMEHEIMAIPTLLLYKDGKIVSNKQGFANLELLEEMVEEIR